MKILFLTPQLPYPAVSGGLIKTLKMIQFLSQFHEIEVGFFLKDNSAEGGALINEFKSSTGLKCFYQYLNIERTGLNFIKSVFSGIPLSIYRNKSSSFKKICDEKSNDCDLIFIDHFLMFQYVPKEWRKKVVFHQHNAEFLMWQRFAETQENIFKRIVLKFEAARIRAYEKIIIEKATTVLASPNDIENLSKITNKKINFVETLHLGDEYLLNETALNFKATIFSILYVGTLTWEANREGLLWFLKNVWPKLIVKFPDLLFDIIGKDNDEFIFREWKSDSRIRWHGFVEDLKPFYDKSRVFIAPLNFGSGIKVKVINALYRGIPTVTTKIGAEGLILKNRIDILISDDSNEQFGYISELLTNQLLWEEISVNSRKTAERLYSWDSVLDKINKVVNDD